MFLSVPAVDGAFEGQTQLRAHALGHAPVVEMEEGVAGVEQDRPERRRAEGGRAQRNRSRAASPSIASRASGS